MDRVLYLKLTMFPAELNDEAKFNVNLMISTSIWLLLLTINAVFIPHTIAIARQPSVFSFNRMPTMPRAHGQARDESHIPIPYSCISQPCKIES